MEDILASIRRIIADDQSQGGKPAAGNGSRRATAQPSEGEPAAARARTPYDDVLDLARLVPSAERNGGWPAGDAVQIAAARHEAPQALDAPAEHERASRDAYAGQDDEAAVSGLRARLPEPTGRGPAQDEDQAMLDHPVPAVTDDEEDDLLSAPLGASVMSAFETLAATVVLQNTPMLERVMRDLLRPMLKTWLDDNLPALVERLVRTEIERVARGSRG